MNLKTVLAALALFLTAGGLCAFSAVSAQLPTKMFDVPEEGLCFPFDGNAEEESGAVTGKLRGDPFFVEGRDGTPDGAIYFETEEDSVLLGLSDTEGSWTASFWVKASDVPHHVFLCSSLTGSLRLIQDNGTVGATMNGIIDRSVPYRVPPDTWTMLTFAYDDDSELTSVYINGEFFDCMYGWQTLGLTLLGNDAPEQKGWQSAPQYALDDVWFFGRMLSDAEILTLYETNTPPPPDSAPAESVEEEAPAPDPGEEAPAPDPEEAPEENVPEPESGAEDLPDDEEPDAEPEDPFEEAAPREPKPGAFAAMAVIILCALFLVWRGLRAIFGRSSR